MRIESRIHSCQGECSGSASQETLLQFSCPPRTLGEQSGRLTGTLLGSLRSLNYLPRVASR
jgi:hypothetical protein